MSVVWLGIKDRLLAAPPLFTLPPSTAAQLLVHSHFDHLFVLWRGLVSRGLVFRFYLVLVSIAVIWKWT